MTDKEKKKLLEAFDIPDPDRKKQFSDEYRKRKPEKIKKPIFPLIMRTVASAAMLALVIAAITRIPKPDPDMFNDNNTIETTTAATSIEASVQTTADNSSAVTTTAVGKDKSKTTTASKAVSTDPAKTDDDNSTVTTEADDPENNEPEPTEHTQKPARTTKTPSVRITTTRESQHHLTTTKPAPQSQTTTVTTSSKASTGEVESGATGKDMTVDIDVKYDVRDEILPVEALSSGNGVGRDGEEKGGNSYTPVDEKIRDMFSDSNAVVLAKVNKIVYTSIDGEAYTAENITITEVFKGSLTPDDRITLFVSGGYINGEEYIKHHRYVLLPDAENYSIYDGGGCAGKEYVGDTYLFFIKNSSSSFPHGSFELISHGDEAVFRQEDDSYVSMHDDSLSLEISSLY